MSGERDLARLLAGLAPERRPGEVVLASLPDAAGLPALATVREPEGVTVVLERADAERLGVAYDWVGTWLTLTVHSHLDAVGLTAAVAGALADAGIPCNVLAGTFHDHLLVPAARAEEALRILRALG